MLFRLVLIALLSSLATILYVRLGVTVLRTGSRSRLHRIFFLTSIGFAVWCFGRTLLPSCPEDQTWFWYRLSMVGWTLVPGLLLHFLILLAGYENLLRGRWVLYAIYAPGVLFLLTTLVSPQQTGVVGFETTTWGWGLAYGGWTAPQAAFLLYVGAAVGLGLWLVDRRGREATLLVRRRQSQLVVFSGLPTLLLIIVSAVVLPRAEIRLLPEVPHLFPALWLVVIYHAAPRYSLLSLTPAVAAQDILRTMGEAVLLLDNDGRLVEINRAAEKLLGIMADEAPGRSIDSVLKGAAPADLKRIREASACADSHPTELELPRRDGRSRTLSASCSTIADENHRTVGTVLMLRDITRQKKIEEQLRFTATHDALTGLPNRILLEDRLDRAVRRARRGERTFAVVTLDLDDFKKVNDSYGHAAGDEVLRQVSRILLNSVRGIDTVCRLSGDEFLVVLEDLEVDEQAEIVIHRIQHSLAQGLLVGDQRVSVTACVGVSFFPGHGDEGEILLTHADLALYSAKSAGKGRHRFFTAEMDEAHRRLRAIEQGLDRAIEKGELFLLYQPIVDLRSQEFRGVEALLRWRSEELGLLQPDEFIPTAERTGQIVPIGDWVLREACRQSRQWLGQGLEPLPVSVNISARQLVGEDFAAKVARCLEEYGLDPSLLELELTESVALGDIERSERLINGLVELGVRIVIDDFGAGQSSLTRLRHLPMHAVKIDRAFIRKITERKKDRDLVTAIIAMARELEVHIVSEGVETSEQMELLRSLEAVGSPDLDRDRVQGFLFSRPVDPETIRELRTRQGSPPPG